MLYNIGGLWLNFEGNNKYFEERCVLFARDTSEKKPEDCDIRVLMEISDDIRKPSGEEVLSGQDTLVLRKNAPDMGYYIYANDVRMPNGMFRKTSLLESNLGWNDIKITCVANDDAFASKDDGLLIAWNQYSTFLSMGAAFRYFLIRKNGIQIHSSSIEYNGKGLIFSAPSGTGKSTHVNLWRELYKDKVTIINEDRPAIRYMDDVPMLCGTPWSGTSDNFSNKIVPLSGIVMLQQAPVNSIEKLPEDKLLPLLMPRCFLPYFDAEMMTEAMNTLERLVKDVPVYLLKCRPDYEAVELVRQCLN